MRYYPFWYQLLYNCVKNIDCYGLALPYIIGAACFNKGTDPVIEDIDDLIDEILGTELPHIVLFRYDYEYQENIFTLVDRGIKPIYHYPLSNNFYLPFTMADGGIDVNIFKQYCRNVYWKHIIEKKYTFNKYLWMPFKEEDYKIIFNSSTISIRKTNLQK